MPSQKRPPGHLSVPGPQAPNRPVSHMAPTGIISSMRPSQSLSCPSQTSSAGSEAAPQISAPSVHTVCPNPQMPSPPATGQARPPPGCPRQRDHRSRCRGHRGLVCRFFITGTGQNAGLASENTRRHRPFRPVSHPVRFEHHPRRTLRHDYPRHRTLRGRQRQAACRSMHPQGVHFTYSAQPRARCRRPDHRRHYSRR